MKELPGWSGYARPVKYLDPAKAKATDIDIFCTKSFRFAYQREYRLVWKPPAPKMGLPYLYVQVGSLHDCCKLIALDNRPSDTTSLGAHD